MMKMCASLNDNLYEEHKKVEKSNNIYDLMPILQKLNKL